MTEARQRCCQSVKKITLKRLISPLVGKETDLASLIISSRLQKLLALITEIAFWLELSAGAVDMEDFNSEVIYAQTLEKLKNIYIYITTNIKAQFAGR